MLLEQARQYADNNRDRFLSELFPLLEIPSISGLEPNPEITRCAHFLIDMMRDLGLEQVELHHFDPDPIIVGSIGNDPDRPTVLIYGHFDVRPIEPLNEWLSPPFEPRVVDGRIRARGAGDNKGQLFAHFKALEFFTATGRDLPVNLKFILDGGEETGSRGLVRFVKDLGHLLTADVAYASDGSMQQPGQPLVILGTKGSLTVHLTVRTLGQSVHGGYSAVLPNAALRLCHLIASIADRDGRILIPGVEDAVVYPEVEAEPYAHRFEDYLAPGASLTCPRDRCHHKLQLEPVMNVDSLAAGAMDVDQNIVTDVASARLNFTLVPEQDPADVFAKLQSHMADLGYDPEWARTAWSIEPSRTPSDNQYVQPIREAVAGAYNREPVLVHSYPSAGPGAIFTQYLDIPGIYVPYAQPDEYNHAPNENLAVDHLLNGVVCSVMVLAALGAAVK